MSQETKRFHKLASGLAITLVAALLPVAVSSPASAAPISSGSLNVVRNFNANDSTFKVYQGERINVSYYNTINLSSVNVGDVLTFSESIGDVTGIQPEWTVNNQYGDSIRATTYTIPSPKPTSLMVDVWKSFTASNTEDLGFDASVTGSGGAVTSLSEYTVINVGLSVTSSGYTAKQGDTQLSFYFRVCVDMGLVAAGDDLELSTANTGGATAQQGGYTGWMTNSGSIQAVSPQTDNQRTIPSPKPTSITVEMDRNFSSLTAGTTYTFSADVKKGNTSVTLSSCPNSGGGGGMPDPLFSLGGASVSGTFTVGQVITATPNSWSRTSGGAVVTTTGSYDWLVCSQAQATSTTSPNEVPCIQGNNLDFILANGTSIGQGGAPGSWYEQSTLTITQPLLDALIGKYLLVVVSGMAASPVASSNVFMQTCGPISAGSTCSVAFGTAPAVVTPPAALPAPKAKVTQKVPAIAKTVKVKKTISFKKTTNAKLLMVVKNSTPKICKVAVKGANFTVTGLKPGNCKITLSQKGSATANPLKATVKTIKVVK